MLTKDHWRNPRAAIATHYQHNDYGYVFHAGILYQEFLSASNIIPSELKNKTVLDYGCGTGRVTRFLSLGAKYAVGYDPTVECIIEGKLESCKIKSSKVPKLLTSDLSKIDEQFDIVVSINVLEHLHGIDHDIAVRNITNLVKEGGEVYLWVLKTTSLPIKDIEQHRDTEGRMLIVRGKKVNGEIAIYENCF